MGELTSTANPRHKQQPCCLCLNLAMESPGYGGAYVHCQSWVLSSAGKALSPGQGVGVPILLDAWRPAHFTLHSTDPPRLNQPCGLMQLCCSLDLFRTAPISMPHGPQHDAKAHEQIRENAGNNTLTCIRARSFSNRPDLNATRPATRCKGARAGQGERRSDTGNKRDALFYQTSPLRRLVVHICHFGQKAYPRKMTIIDTVEEL